MASIPAYATNLEGLSKRLISPNSLIITAPRTKPIERIVLIKGNIYDNTEIQIYDTTRQYKFGSITNI